MITMERKYKKYWIGKCVDEGDTINLLVGELYLLQDMTGEKKHLLVSKIMSEGDCFLGAYGPKYFDILEDVTDGINTILSSEEPIESDLRYNFVKAVSIQRQITMREAQTQLLQEGKLDVPVLRKEEKIQTETKVKMNNKQVEKDQKPEITPTESQTSTDKAHKPIQTSLFNF